jgi:3-deoxy-D-manno-octulosonate 8-phosphate phosphatase (KDO 8-P phosphatase)
MEIIARAKLIKFIIFDVDGVLTDGKVYYNNQGICHKPFNVYDGLGIKLLKQTGINIGIITGCTANIITNYCQKFGINYLAQNQEDKLIPFNAWQQELQLSDTEIAYVGDDLPDLPILQRVGLAIAVNNAVAIVKKYAHYTTYACGGSGAVREVCELIMTAQGEWQRTIDLYLQ